MASRSPYHEAADLINKIIQSTTSTSPDNSSHEQHNHNPFTSGMIKNHVYEKKTGHLLCTTKTYALVCKVFEHYIILYELIQYLDEIQQQQQHQNDTTNGTNNNSNSSSGNKTKKQQHGTNDKTKKKNPVTVIPIVRNQGLLYVLLFELLFSTKQSIMGGGALKRYIVQQEKNLRTKIRQSNNYIPMIRNSNTKDKKDHDNNTNNHEKFPRYIRCNTYGKIINVQSSFVQSIFQPYQTILKIPIALDPHIPDLLVVPYNATSQILQYYQQQQTQQQENNKKNNSTMTIQKNDIILQDKSSCFSALCLVHGFDDHDSETNDDGDYLDACAAPGNKTSHLAALVDQEKRRKMMMNQEQEQKPVEVATEKVENNTTKKKNTKNNKNKNNNHLHGTTTTTTIYALDRDEKRYKSLERRMKELLTVVTHSSIPESNNNENKLLVQVVTHHQDFLTTTPSIQDKHENHHNGSKSVIDYSNVTAILLDPSCSGSGIVTSNDRGSSIKEDHHDHHPLDERLQKLSGFQITALRHAMTNFPKVNKIVYSTCSIHYEENENVIASVLCHNEHQTTFSHHPTTQNDNPTIASTTATSSLSSSLRDEWEVIAPKCLQHWTRRGITKKTSQDDDSKNKDSKNKSSIKKKKMTNDETNHVNDNENDDNTVYITKDEAQCMIRVDPKYDETNGFFVCCLQRKKKEENQKSTNSSPKKQTTATTTTTATSACPIPNPYGIPFYEPNMFATYKPPGSSSSSKRKVEGNSESTKDKSTVTSSSKKDSSNNNNKKRKSTESSSTIISDSVNNKKKMKKGKVVTTTGGTMVPKKNNHNNNTRTEENDDDDDDDNNNNNDKAQCKKRLRKLEWKSRQQREKIKRLKSTKQQQQTTNLTTNTAV